LERYRSISRAGMKEALDPDFSLRDGLRRVYDAALSMYFSGKMGARGCFMIGTAATEAVLDPKIRASLGDGLREIDEAFEARFRLALARGEIGQKAEPAMLARLASAVLYFLAVRSPAGGPRP